MPATLLLADDSVTIQRVIELTFANEDVKVVSMSDGETARQQIDAAGEPGCPLKAPPDIVLADVGMPKLDGYDLAAHVKRTPKLKHIPVMLLTGAFEPIDEDKARASGCDGILVKPFEPQQLISRVKELLKGERTPALWPEHLPRVEPPPRPATPVPAPVPAAAAPPPVPEAVVPPAERLAQPERPGFGLSPRIPVAPPTEKPESIAAPPSVAPAPAPAATEPAAAPQPPAPSPPAPSPVRPAIAPKPASAADWAFQKEMEELDAKFADLDPESAAALDDDTASDFARDLDAYRSGSQEEAAERPGTPTAGLTEPSHTTWDLGAVDAGGAPKSAPPPAPPTDATEPGGKISIAGAFSALLAAEQAAPPQRPRAAGPQLSEAAVEEVVRRVLARMTDQTVRQIVLETAERLIKEEIEKIRSNP